MATILETLIEQRDAADKAFEDYATPLIAENRTLTEDEDTKLEELRSRRGELDARITKGEEDARLAEAVMESRKRLGTADVDISNVKEARTYGPGSKNSYFADFIRSSNPMFPGHAQSNERLNQYAKEVAGEMRDLNSPEGQRAIRSIRESYRETSAVDSDDAVSRAIAFASYEARQGMDTTAASGGSFVTPQYFVAQYAPFRQFSRVFADQANKQDLPDYGMTIYLPQVSSAAGVGAQVGQNAGITETDPSAGYLSTALTTNAGQVTVSQQLLDRAGPNFQFDKMIFDQLQRAYNLTLDQYVLTQALANAGTISATTAALTGTGGIFAKIGQAKAATVDASGVVLPATHAFFQPANWEWAAVQTNVNGATFVTPNYAGPFNSAFAGSDASMAIAEGDTGYKVSGLRVFEDGNIPVSGTTSQVIVAHMPEVYFWEGDMVSRVIPQTVAQNLSVLLQVYAYVGCIVRYPKAVQTLQGIGIPLVPTF